MNTPNKKVNSSNKIPLPVLSGDLSMMGVANAINNLHLNKKTGRLIFPPNPGEIFFSNGNIIHAVLAAESPKIALYKILRYNTGNFQFEEQQPQCEKTITEDTITLLYEGANIADELESLTAPLEDLAAEEALFLEIAISEGMLRHSQILYLWKQKQSQKIPLLKLVEEIGYLTNEEIDKINKLVTAQLQPQQDDAAFALLDDFAEEDKVVEQKPKQAKISGKSKPPKKKVKPKIQKGTFQAKRLPKTNEQSNEQIADAVPAKKQSKQQEKDKGQQQQISTTEDERIKQRKRLQQIAESADIGLTARIRKKIEEEFIKEQEQGKADSTPSAKQPNRAETVPEKAKIKKRASFKSLKEKAEQKAEQKDVWSQANKDEAKWPTKSVQFQSLKDKAKESSDNPNGKLEWLREKKRLLDLADQSQIGLTAKIKKSLAKQRVFNWNAIGKDTTQEEEIPINPISCMVWIVAIISLGILFALFLESLFR